ncbi:MAG: hypothetical protein JXA13_07665 [Anaerolineales bacterium]|nr:hypothetical protein [Anaerolineales bacterium]
MDNLAAGIILGVVIIIMVVIYFVLKRSASRVDLSNTPEGEKPEWMKAMPPEETLKAALADGEGIPLFDYDEGERIAAPFAEQVEDILRDMLQKDTDLKAYDVDFGTAEGGDLNFYVNGEVYRTVSEIPVEGLRQAITEAVNKYNQRPRN